MPTLLFPPLSFLSTELIYFSLYDSLSQPFPLRSLSYFTPLVLTPSVSSLMFCIFQNDTVYLRCCLCHSTPSASPLSMLIPSILPFIHLSALMTVTLETWISCQDPSLSAAWDARTHTHMADVAGEYLRSSLERGKGVFARGKSKKWRWKHEMKVSVMTKNVMELRGNPKHQAQTVKGN